MRQLGLKLETSEERAEALRKYLAPLKMPPRQVAVLCLVSGHGQSIEIAGQRASQLTISKQNAAKLLDCSANTFMAGVRDLRRLGVLDIVAVSRPATYMVNWDRVARIQPASPRPVAELSLFQPDQTRVWSGLVNGGQPAATNTMRPDARARRDSVIKTYKVRDRDSVPVTRDTCAADQTPAWWRQPWNRESGVTDADLVEAVTTGKTRPLRRLYVEAVALGWIGDCEDARLRFLVICHHAATSTGLTRSRMGAVVSRVKRDLDIEKTRQASEDWAAKVLRRRDSSRVEVPP